MDNNSIKAIILAVLYAAATFANIVSGFVNYKRKSWKYAILNFIVAGFLLGTVFLVVLEKMA